MYGEVLFLKKILVITGSPRKGGNTDALVERFAAGALAAGHEVEIINLREKKIGYCVNCNYCRDNKADCVFDDDARKIVQKALDCDVMVLATPVYFYNVTAQMKTMIDRFFAREHEFWALPEKDCYYLLINAGLDHHQDSTIAVLDGFIKCLRTVKVKGMVQASRTMNKGDIDNSVHLAHAYEMGKNVDVK